MFTASELEDARNLVHSHMPGSPQYAWPQLEARLGTKVWVKHENHTPTGSFKVRGAFTFIDWLKRTRPDCPGIITATRGNHGQGQALAATAAGMRAVVYVPRGNSVEKNAAMRAFGAELIEFGDDFDEAREEVFRVADAEGLAFVPPFHRELVRGWRPMLSNFCRPGRRSTRFTSRSAAARASADASPHGTPWD